MARDRRILRNERQGKKKQEEKNIFFQGRYCVRTFGESSDVRMRLKDIWREEHVLVCQVALPYRCLVVLHAYVREPRALRHAQHSSAHDWD